ncbi:uncharacterized protein LOC108669093 [Hyalella azteca]|uniref:Uncharacterized protein LOC108669093 n=1 Tax=Hyalella azteca TaxID=294128 RepID=A0A979FRJ3_HYAAZ|nr:uncharacterized protein LOC108669093 [Hyalella azteca]
MLSIVFVSVVLGLASAAPQGFPLETSDVQAARNAFINEYNRLAALAAAAPDIHIIMANRRLDDPNLNIIPHHNHVQAPVQKAFPAFNKFAFSANLGTNQQFVPQANTFPHQAGHLAGHLAGHQVAVPQHTFAPQPHAGPIQKWNGPLADTVPAGVHGLPTQVMDTPEVAAAKAAHFAALNAAYQSAPRFQVFVSVVLGLASAAPQGFPLETSDVQAARNAFINEYNRLAALAAAAPDIHIIMANRRLDDPNLNIIPHHNHVQAPVQKAFPAFNKFAFSANLGTNQQFVPQANTFPHQAGHLAGHLAGHQVAVPQHTFAPQPHAGPIQKWNGPLADTVPAGVHGLPTQVMDTPEVAAAKAAHFAALNAAYQSAPRQNHF